MSKNNYIKAERFHRIVDDIEKDGSISVSDLASKFKVSRETIRRDLSKLEKNGVLKRLHGGAIRTSYRIDLEVPFNLRKNRFYEQKRIIGIEAAKLIKDGDTVIIDDSSTALQVAKAIKNDISFTVITNSFQVASDLVSRHNTRIIFLGGDLRERSFSCVGQMTVKIIRNYHVNKVILGTEGFSIKEGLTDSFDIEVELKQAMIDIASEVIVVVDSSKFEKVFFAKVASIDKVHTVVTDANIPSDVKAALEERHISLIIANSD